MTDFDPALHTPDALVHELWQLAKAVPDVLVVGSLGRAAFYGHTTGNPTYEYERRGQLPLQSFLGGPADIDVLGGPYLHDLQEDIGPFKIDPRTLDGRQVSVVHEDGTWHLRSANRGFSAVLDPALFEPVSSRTIYDAPCNTVPVQTHLALLGVSGTLRPQDVLARKLLSERIREDELATIPDEAFEPFEELRELNRRSAFNRLRTAYRGIVPKRIRQPLAPLMQPIKDHLLR